MIFVFFHIFLHTLTNMFFHIFLPSLTKIFAFSQTNLCSLANIFMLSYIFFRLHSLRYLCSLISLPYLAEIFVFSRICCILSHVYVRSHHFLCSLTNIYSHSLRFVCVHSQCFFFLAFSHKDSCVLAHLFVFSWTARKMREIANILAREHKDSRGDAKVLWENTKALM